MTGERQRGGSAHVGDVGIEVAPMLEATSPNRPLAQQLDVILPRVCTIARALTGAEQAGLKLSLDDDPANARKYFSPSEKYSDYRDFRVDPKGLGLHGMVIPPGEVVRLTEQEVLDHSLFENFGRLGAEHPPMRGWLATSVRDGRNYGLLQLSDKSGGAEFNADDESHIRELAALVGETLDALRKEA